MRTHMPIDAWVENIGKKLPILKHDELYEPVSLRIKTTGRIASPDGTVKHNVNTDDKSWYQTLQRDLATVAFAMPEREARYLSLRDMENRDIASMTHAQLATIGEVDVFDTRTGKQLLAEERRTPSAHLHGNKLNKLYEWAEDTNVALAAHIAKELAGCATIEELDLRTQPDSPLHASIRDKLAGSPGRGGARGQCAKIGALLQSHGANEAARKADATAVADKIATAVLTQVRAGINANGPKIMDFFARRVATSAKEGVAPLLQKFRATTAPGPTFQDDRSLYQHVAEKALKQAAHIRSTVYSIYKPSAMALDTIACGDSGCRRKGSRSPSPSSRSESPRSRSPSPVKERIGNRAYAGSDASKNIHDWIGTKSSGRTRPSSTRDAPPSGARGGEERATVGEGVVAARRQQLFSGKSIYMSPRATGLPPRAPGLPVYQVREAISMPALSYLDAAKTGASSKTLPKLVPLGSQVPAAEPRGSSKVPPMPKLVPLGSEVGSRAMPKLVPLGSAAGQAREQDFVLPKLVPIGRPLTPEEAEEELNRKKTYAEAVVKGKGSTRIGAQAMPAGMPGLVPISSLIPGPPPLKLFATPATRAQAPMRVSSPLGGQRTGAPKSMQDILRSGNVSW